MKKYVLGLLILLLTATLCACGNTEEGQPTANPEEQTETTSQAEPSVDVQIETESQQYTLADGETPALDFSCQKPVVTITGTGTDEATQKVNEDIELLDETFVNGDVEGNGIGGRDALIAAAQEHFDARQAEGIEGEFGGYYLHREVTPARQTNGVLSLVYEDSYYTGGAHGGVNRTGINYDLQTGERLTLSNIAVDEASITSFFTDKILEISQGDAYKIEGVSMFFDDYAENISSIVMDGLWYFSDEGMVFIANPYVLAPYSAGTIEFTIPYDDLTGMIQDEYLF